MLSPCNFFLRKFSIAISYNPTIFGSKVMMTCKSLLLLCSVYRGNCLYGRGASSKKFPQFFVCDVRRKTEKWARFIWWSTVAVLLEQLILTHCTLQHLKEVFSSELENYSCHYEKTASAKIHFSFDISGFYLFLSVRYFLNAVLLGRKSMKLALRLPWHSFPNYGPLQFRSVKLKLTRLGQG